MPLMRNKSATVQVVPGAGEAGPGQVLAVPEHLAAGLTGPAWEPAEAPASDEAPAPAGEEHTPAALLEEDRESEA
ncbi:MAG: hypothetical protein V1797_20815 [Pseudomonadota bacterium]